MKNTTLIEITANDRCLQNNGLSQGDQVQAEIRGGTAFYTSRTHGNRTINRGQWSRVPHLAGDSANVVTSGGVAVTSN